MNRVLLTGRLTRDPELRNLANGRTMAQFGIATNEYRGGAEKTEYHTVITWERLAEICAQYLGKGQLVAIEGRLQTRQWEDDQNVRHWKTEIVASNLEMLSGRRKKDYAAESAAEALAAQGEAMGEMPPGRGTDPGQAESGDEGPDAEADETGEEAERVAA